MPSTCTVGYGDVKIQEARLFACLHIVVSVWKLGALITLIADLRTKRSSQLKPVLNTCNWLAV